MVRRDMDKARSTLKQFVRDWSQEVYPFPTKTEMRVLWNGKQVTGPS
jgi:hypothetical protein